MAESSDYKIKVIDKMFKLVDVLEQADHPLGVNEIARQTELNVVTAFRILKTMTDAGWAYQDKEDKYSAGYRLCSYYNMNKFYMLLKDAAYSVMHRLTEQEGEVLNLCVRQNDVGILLQQTKTSRFADYVVHIGTALPLYATACGKVLISELPTDIVRKLAESMNFRAYTEKTIANVEQLIDCLNEVRQLGYALDCGESLQNTCCIAVPIRNPAGDIFASISFSGLTNVLPEEKKIYYLDELMKASNEIATQLFHVYTGQIPREE